MTAPRSLRSPPPEAVPSLASERPGSTEPDEPSQPLTDARPIWIGVRSAAQALGLQRHELLHAGPPLENPRRPPRTLASSIVMTCLHEGWAANEAAAEALLYGGELSLAPAQDHDCVTPLAAIVSASTPLFEVSDECPGQPVMHAPVSVLRGIDTRMGCRDPGLFGRLRERDRNTATALERLIDATGPMPLWGLAAHGLARGDDLHGSTTHANLAFAQALRERGAGALADDIADTPLFFLTLWMAASALLLRIAEQGDTPTLVTRAGGNGERFAIALAGRPETWIACDAEPPNGPRLPNVSPELAIEGAIGDSAVIDMLGLGGQRLAHAPQLLAQFEALPEVAAQALLSWPQPLLPQAWPLGLDAATVVRLQQAPRVMLAMLARDGASGLCGRGIYQPPLDLFSRALHEQD